MSQRFLRIETEEDGLDQEEPLMSRENKAGWGQGMMAAE